MVENKLLNIKRSKLSMHDDLVIFDRIDSDIAKAVAALCESNAIKVYLLTAFQKVAKLDDEYRFVFIFDTPKSNEGSISLDDDYQSLEIKLDLLMTDVTNFLNSCHVGINLCIQKRAGKILTICVDDVMSEQVGIPNTPIANQARIGAIKSLAKEYAKSGVIFNVVICHPVAEIHDANSWRKLQNNLKVYTLRYSPYQLDEYSQFIFNLIVNNYPMNGSVLNLGAGIVETVG